jgi:hypothetical protein
MNLELRKTRIRKLQLGFNRFITHGQNQPFSFDRRPDGSQNGVGVCDKKDKIKRVIFTLEQAIQEQ